MVQNVVAASVRIVRILKVVIPEFEEAIGLREIDDINKSGVEHKRAEFIGFELNHER